MIHHQVYHHSSSVLNELENQSNWLFHHNKHLLFFPCPRRPSLPLWIPISGQIIAIIIKLDRLRWLDQHPTRLWLKRSFVWLINIRPLFYTLIVWPDYSPIERRTSRCCYTYRKRKSIGRALKAHH